MQINSYIFNSTFENPGSIYFKENNTSLEHNIIPKRIYRSNLCEWDNDYLNEHDESKNDISLNGSDA